jgi:hypothetical protein
MQGYKDSHNRPFIPTIVADNFFEAPDLWREFALRQEYFKGDRGTWPGLRTDMLSNLNPNLHNLLIDKIVKTNGLYTKIDKADFSFQLIDKSYGAGWVHDDDDKHTLAGVIYLSDNCPINAGTTIYEKGPDFNSHKYFDVFYKDVTAEPGRETDEASKYRDEHKNNFNTSIVTEGRYNRCIMFDPRQWHSADNFFGETTEDTRLTIVFFCTGG